MSVIRIKEIEFGSNDYKRAVTIREEILRNPLGISFSKEELEEEASDIHIAGFSDETMIGTQVLSLQNKEIIRMRQVAVHSGYQKRGIGKQLVEFSENFAVKKEYKKMILDSREDVIPFYTKLGYSVFGDRFESVSLPHFCMERQLV